MKTNTLAYCVDKFAEASTGCTEAYGKFLAMALGRGLRIEILRDCELSDDIGGEILCIVHHLKCSAAFRQRL